MKFGNVYSFRALCPVCSVTVRGDRVIAHLRKQHEDLDADDLAQIHSFIEDCVALQARLGLRLQLNLQDLSFEVLPGRTTIPEELHTAARIAPDDALALVQCPHCNKLVLPASAEQHLRIHRSAGARAFRSLRLLPRYARCGLPAAGWSVQGGAPGLGKGA